MGLALPGWPACTLFMSALRLELARARKGTLQPQSLPFVSTRWQATQRYGAGVTNDTTSRASFTTSVSTSRRRAARIASLRSSCDDQHGSTKSIATILAPR
jgi:hypothetical protein